ncbi:MAG TPA: hypothetical protein VGO62_08905, partial [Myxococcota bacterium]
PNRLVCDCDDGSTPSVCASDEVCASQAAERQCDALCTGHGALLEVGCRTPDFACMLGAPGSASGVVCPCAGSNDGGACTSLSCDDDASTIASVCASYCPDGTGAPTCVRDAPLCASDGVPPGPDVSTCDCLDGSELRSCVGGGCNVPLDHLCDDLCGAHGGSGSGSTCSIHDEVCELGPQGGPNGVSCNCGNNAVGACTALDCNADADAIVRACGEACAGPNAGSTPHPTCAPDDSCAAGGLVHGPDQSFCHCGDDTVNMFCTDGCFDCTQSCHDHGGLSDTFVSGCGFGDLSCLVGDGGGPHGVVCTCGAANAPFEVARCGDVDCGDEAALTALCEQGCFGSGQAAPPRCVVDDSGCRDGNNAPRGPNKADGTCGDGTHITHCVSDCADNLGVNLPAFVACHGHGELQSFSCVADPSCD